MTPQGYRPLPPSVDRALRIILISFRDAPHWGLFRAGRYQKA
jgi:hypothetical protein